MAIQWADDFSRYGTGSSGRLAMLDGLPYSNIATGSVNRGTPQPDPDTNVLGGRAFKLSDGSPSPFNQFRIALPTPVSGTVRTALRFWPQELPSTASERMSPIGFQNVSGTVLAYILVEQNGSFTVQARVSDTITQVANTVVPVISPSSWNHIEMEFNRSAGTGAVYVNGVSVLTFSGVDTDDGNVAFVHSLSATGNTNGQECWIKDLVISDNTGTANTGLNGTVIVRRLKPTSDIALGDWVPSTGSTGHNLLAKDAPNDTTYLSAPDTLPSADMRFNLENLPADITSVRALISVTRHRKIDGGDGNLQTALSPDGTNWDNGDNRAITSSFQYDFDVSELNPATASAWTPVAVDSAQLRIDRTV